MPQPYIFRTVELDHQSIRTAVRPGKPHLTPLLIFNGIGANLELVFPFIDALDPDLEVIAFDVPGVGGSSTPRHPYRFPGLAKLTARMLDYLDYGQVNVIGVSWGGALAQQFAHDYPERCKKLVLAATAAGAVMVPGKPKVLWMMASPRRYVQPSHVIRIAPMIYGGGFRRDPDLAMHHAAKVRSGGKLGYYWQLFAGLGWTSIHWLHKIQQPTLVLAGDDDPLIPLINMRLLAWRIPNAQLHIIDDGHLFLITRAEAVAPIIMKFLQQERQRAVMHPRPASGVKQLRLTGEMDQTRECCHERQTGQRIDNAPRHPHERAERHPRPARSRPAFHAAQRRPPRSAPPAAYRASSAGAWRAVGAGDAGGHALPAEPA